MTDCVWLASYPKSGNTWFRALWTNYHRGERGPFSINAMEATPIVSGRSLLDDELPFDTGDLTHAELLVVRPHALREVARGEGPRPLLFKVHDAYERNRLGESSFPVDVTRCAVYILRNPLDVCVSYAHHNSCTVERALRFMNDPHHAMAEQQNGQSLQTRQFMGTWSDHVRSWVDEAPFPVHVVRYEDMKKDTAGTFTAALRAMGLEPDAARVAHAVEAARFERLREQEQQQGFAERNPRGSDFFRSGRTEAWREEMTLQQAERLIAVHRKTMERFGYATTLHPADPVNVTP